MTKNKLRKKIAKLRRPVVNVTSLENRLIDTTAKRQNAEEIARDLLDTLHALYQAVLVDAETRGVKFNLGYDASLQTPLEFAISCSTVAIGHSSIWLPPAER